jgi:hypothetical protein
VAGIVGAPYRLIRDTGAILLDMNPDKGITEGVRKAVEQKCDFYRDRLRRFGSLQRAA